MWSDILLRLRALVRPGRAESDLDEELAFHLEMETRRNLASGLTDAEARQSARVGFGGVEQVREECREVRGLSTLENLARDAAYGIRVLRKTPVFASIAVLSLAIGIGANTAVFSLVDTVLLQMLPVRNPEQLVVVRWGAHKDLDLTSTAASGGRDENGNRITNVVSWAIFSEMRARSRMLKDVMGFSWLGPANVGANGRALSTGVMLISGNYFQTLGVKPLLGRPITDDDEMAGGAIAAVISYGFWDRAFGLDPAVVGKSIYVNAQPCIVIGVTPKQFFGVSAGGFLRTPVVDIMLPIRTRERLDGAGQRNLDWFGDDLFWIQTMGRLKPESGNAAISSEIAATIASNLPEAARRDMGREKPIVVLDSGSRGLDSLRRFYHEPLLILMAVVGLTLLMACANLAGLLLARAAARRKEIMLRLAIGATRARLVRQLLVEGALISASGTVAGIAFAWWGVRSLLALLASGAAPIAVAVAPDLRVLAFTAAMAVAATFLFALAPAVRATRVDVASGLKEDTPVAGMRGFGAGRMLVAIQVAVAFVLFSGAVMFTRSLTNLRSLPLGFNPYKLVLFDLAPGTNGYDETRANQLYSRVIERLRQIPGVRGVSVSTSRLISGFMSNGGIVVEGESARRRQSMFNFVGPDFLEVMAIPVIAGRGIESRDMNSTARVAVINETVAHRYFGAGSPVGRRFRWSYKNTGEVEVVGVAKDAKFERLRGEAPPTVYAPYTQIPFGWPQEMSFEVRTAGNPTGMVAEIRRVVAGIDRMLPVTDVKTQEAEIDDSLAQERLFASLVSLFGAITLVLACVGLYGLVAYMVTRRTRELGVRIALGAGRMTVLRMILSQVAVTIGAGLAVGVPLAWMLSRVIESQLYGVKAHDAISLAAASIGVLAIAIVAAFVPARRAMGIDPVRALRYE